MILVSDINPKHVDFITIAERVSRTRDGGFKLHHTTERFSFSPKSTKHNTQSGKLFYLFSVNLLCVNVMMFYSVSEAQGKQGERCPETPSCIEGENKPWFLGKGA